MKSKPVEPSFFFANFNRVWGQGLMFFSNQIFGDQILEIFFPRIHHPGSKRKRRVHLGKYGAALKIIWTKPSFSGSMLIFGGVISMKSTLPRIKLLKEAWCFCCWKLVGFRKPLHSNNKAQVVFSKFPKRKFVLKQPSESKCLNACELKLRSSRKFT